MAQTGTLNAMAMAAAALLLAAAPVAAQTATGQQAPDAPAPGSSAPATPAVPPAVPAPATPPVAATMPSPISPVAAPADTSPATAPPPAAPVPAASPTPAPDTSPTPTASPPVPAPRAPPTPTAAPVPLPTAAPAPAEANQVIPSTETLDVVNKAKVGDVGVKDGVSPAILRAEVMLDRLHASPGVIDGRDGENFEHAVETYEKVKGLKVGKGLDDQVWAKLLSESGAPVLQTYKLTADDVAGPFYPDLPTDYAQLAKLPTLGYRSPAQKIGAKFHLGETLLAALNPGVDLGKAGATILATMVTPEPIHDKLKTIVVDKTTRQVVGYDADGRILVAYPATIGSQALPSPSGTYKVRGVAHNPIYYYDPKNFLQGDNHGKLKLPAGPNNPVGLVFIALTKPSYGLHGTPDPSKIDKTASHGCVRMTNWNALELSTLVRPGIVVSFKK